MATKEYFKNKVNAFMFIQKGTSSDDNETVLEKLSGLYLYKWKLHLLFKLIWEWNF